MMHYRKDIDGLRAVAVLPVILFHAGLPAFSGGYVGVDIFFVISGYLITGIILSELADGRFSFVRFYERRVRRILPALYGMLACCLLLAWLILLPSDLKDFAKSLLSVVLYLSNFIFAANNDYFAVNSELLPLLHTWSLAVEEQFYLLVPALLWLTWRWRRTRLLFVLLILFGLSLVFATWQVRHDPTSAFYLLPARAWELLLGGLVATVHVTDYWQRTAQTLTRPLADGLALSGLALIIWSILAFDSTTTFPGASALLPTGGAALILLVQRQDTWAYRLLSLSPFVGIGLISYSAYLWHQPLFAFARAYEPYPPSPLLMAGMVALTLALAWASWRYVETPFRDRQRVSSRQIWRLTAICSLLLILAAGVLYVLAKQDPRRTADNTAYAELDAQRKGNFGLSRLCDKAFTLDPLCRTGDSPRVAIWGDSYAMHLVDAIRTARPDVGLIQFTKSACPPVMGVAPISGGEYNQKWAETCIQFNQSVHDWLLNNDSVELVIVSSPLTRLLRVENQLLTGNGPRAVDVELVLAAMRQTMDLLAARQIQVLWFSPPPQSGYDIGHCLVRQRIKNAALSACDFKRDAAVKQQSAVRALLERLAQSHPVVDLMTIFCTGEHCITHADGVLLYRDEGHLSHAGARWLGERLAERAILQRPVAAEVGETSKE